MTITAPELISTLADDWSAAMQSWAEQSQSQSQALWDRSQDLWDRWSAAAGTVSRPGPRHRHHHGSDRCKDGCAEHPQHDRAECRDLDHGRCECGECCCCSPHADVVLHARAGERRIVAFLLRNPWRRERPVRIEVTPWQSSSGADLSVTAAVDDATITLQPCENRVVRLALAIGCERTAQAPDEQDAEHDPAGETTVARERKHAVCDVTRCESGYVDVRFEGCARPQRVAVVVSPTHCDPVDVGCDCGCGCC